MKICLINNLYKSFGKGGAEIITETIARELSKNDFDIFVITTKPPFTKKKDGEQVYYLKSFFYYLDKIPRPIRFFWHINDMFNIKNYIKLNKIIKKEKPDIIITNNLKGIGFLSPICFKKNNIKHIHILHDIQLIHPSGLLFYKQEKMLDSFFAKTYSQISKKLFSSPNAIISPSSWLADFHTKKGFFPKSKIYIIPNPIQKTIIDDEIKKTKTIKLVYVGQIEKHKGVEFLVEAFNELKNNNIVLDIVGDGKELKKLKSKYQKNKKIIFLGKKDRLETLKIIKSSDIMIIPSICYENSPTVIYEAVQLNTFPIGSELGGIPELIKNLAGKTFKPLDKKDLIFKIEETVKNFEEIKDKTKKAELEIRKYSAENYILKIKKIIKS